MPTDLADQLAAYGTWLGQTTDADLTPLDRPIDDAAHHPGSHHEPDRRSLLGNSWLQVAAAVIIAVGIGGLVVAQRNTNPSPTAAQYSAPVDPEAQLFVLPTDLRSLELSSGEVYTARPDDGDPSPEESTAILIGTEVDGGISDLVSISVTGTIPNGFDDDRWIEVETSTGPARVSIDGFPFPTVTQQRGDVWLMLTGATGNEDLIDLLSHVAIDSSGSLTIQNDQRVIIDEFSPDPLAASYSTFYNITDPTSGITFEVETATSPSAIFLGTYTPDPVRPTTVNGAAAWILTRDDDATGGTQTGIVWRATPNRIIAIGAQASLDEVQAMAERLQQVTKTEWLAALPGASSQN